MHKYFIKTPWIVKKIFPSYVWDLPGDGDTVYLSFDDGPHPEITPWVLEQLAGSSAQASFFCIGQNAERYPEVFKHILAQGHSAGNHTHHHLNGWKTADKIYLDDVAAAAKLIDSHLFRPPYGRIKTSQAKKIAAVLQKPSAKIIMWDVLSGDFDKDFSPQQCFENVSSNLTAGSIVVFHDSEKAWKNLKFALPATLRYLSEAGYRMKAIM